MTQADLDRNEIIEMAKLVIGNYAHEQYWLFFTVELEHFAKLVADVATAKEREACAKVCELESGDGPDNGCCPTFWNEAQEACAAAIRARGETT